MERVIKLNVCGITHLKEMIKTLNGVDNYADCPNWNKYSKEVKKWEDDCEICEELFPKSTIAFCPCDVYANEHLVKRLKEIIAYNEKGG